MDRIKRISAVIIAIVCCFLYWKGFGKSEDVIVVSVDERDFLKIVLMDNENTLVPVTIEVPFVMDEAQSIKTAFEYMDKNKSYNGLNGFLNSNAEVDSVIIDDTQANVNVNQSFFSVDKRNNRKVAEALVAVIHGNTNIEEIILSENGMLLETIPYTSIAIKDMVYSLPMNVFESENSLHNTIPFTKYSFEKINNNFLLVPKTYYIKGEKSVEFVLKMYCKTLIKEGLFESIDNIMNSYHMNTGKLFIDLSSELCFEENVIDGTSLNLLLLMLFDNLPINSITLSIEGEPYYYENGIQQIHRKDLVYNIWKI